MAIFKLDSKNGIRQYLGDDTVDFKDLLFGHKTLMSYFVKLNFAALLINCTLYIENRFSVNLYEYCRIK